MNDLKQSPSIKRIPSQRCPICYTARYSAFMKEESVDYTFLADLHKELASPEDGIQCACYQRRPHASSDG
jgi:hypothetical protein